MKGTNDLPVISVSGVRGIYGTSLTTDFIYNLLNAFILVMQGERKSNLICVGRDGRSSGATIASSVNSMLAFYGFNVAYAGITSTPTLAFITKELNADAGIMITASHNPPHWNGFKFYDRNGIIFSNELMQRIKACLTGRKIGSGGVMPAVKTDIIPDPHHMHIKKILSSGYVCREFKWLKEKRLLVDGINSGGSFLVPALLNSLGLKNYSVINTEIGKFARDPEPVAKNLSHVCELMRSGEFFLGIVVDPDVDRVVFIDEKGQIANEELTIVLVLDYLFSRFSDIPEVAVINKSTTSLVEEISNKYGFSVVRVPVGEYNIIRGMMSENAFIGGEGSGGVIFSPIHYSRDALTTIALVLSMIELRQEPLSKIISGFPHYNMVKIKIPDKDGSSFKNILQNIKDTYPLQEMRIDEEDGLWLKDVEELWWLHIRPSNTEPVIRIIYEWKGEYIPSRLKTLLSKLSSVTGKS